MKNGSEIDLGLAVSRLSLSPGQTRSYTELARFCGCSHEAIRKIERRAMKKIRNSLKALTGDPELAELVEGLR